jgi:hypothetical protein
VDCRTSGPAAIRISLPLGIFRISFPAFASPPGEGSHVCPLSNMSVNVMPAAILGLSLISCGILALLISIGQYWWSIRDLWSEPSAPIAGVTEGGMHTPVIAVAILLIGIGLFALFAALLRVA